MAFRLMDVFDQPYIESVDLLKIDIEGAERQALGGSHELTE